MLPEVFPEINIYWNFDNEKAKEYKLAYSRLVVGQLNAVGDDTVGVVIVENMRRAIPIVLDAGYAFVQIGQRLSAATLITDYYYPAIFLEKIYFDVMRKNPIIRSNIYHEVGHVYLKHMNRDPNNKRQISKERTEAKQKGEVFWQEREADAFACHYVGKERMIAHLGELKKILVKLARSDRTFAAGLSEQIAETDNRISLIQKTF